MWVSKRIVSIIAAVAVIALIITASGYSIAAISDGYACGVVVIDAGHGGIDGGVKYGDMLEKEINLDISNKLKTKLELQGYKVVMTRTSDAALSDDKKADMQARKAIIEKARPDIVISIHVNNFTSDYRRGAQVFYDDTNRNRDVGDRMQSVLNTYINERYSGRSDLKALGGDYFITKCTKYPTVIVETAFMSNPADRQLLKSDAYKNDICDAITKAVAGMLAEAV